MLANGLIFESTLNCINFRYLTMPYMRIAILFLTLLSFGISNAQEQFSLYFDSNQYDLKTSEVDKLFLWLKDNPKVKVVALNGYTDEDGTTGFNETLAEKRVATVASFIRGKVKIRDDFKTRSFGELHKHSPKKALNRKVTIYYLLEKDLPKEEEILGLKKVVIAQLSKPKFYPQNIVIDNPNGTQSEFKLDTIFMRQVERSKPGDKLKIENLNFQLNTFAVTNESRGKLFELLIVMQDNPNLKIEIQGHLCCMPVDRTDLSTQRARAVYKFLETFKIPKNRLSYKGFGSTQPIYPIPEVNEEQRAANRRVEILVIENPVYEP